MYWEDFPVGSRREFGGITVTKEAIIAFAREFDPQPFHIDEERAKESPYGGLIASGWHTCAMTMRMICDGYLLDAASLGSPGIEKLEWKKPVFPGDTLRVRHETVEARPMASKPHIGLMRSRAEVLNQRDEVVLTFEGWGMFRRRPQAAPAGA
ncbi:MAG TPA: MaoC family dehydratase [Burkholderiaceae bacterium]|nr:MaoC family dehydratase [Burkholderiaceae bacterium]